MNNKFKPFLFVLFLVLPLVVRQVVFQPGWYTPPEVPDVHNNQVSVPAPSFEPAEDTPTLVGGRVVIDLSHGNNLELDDLVPLRDRLAVRGVTIITVGRGDQYSTASLPDALRGANSLVVLAPTYLYSPEERLAVVEFVKDGGKLLLGADPTRPYEEGDRDTLDLYSVLFPVSAVPAINSLANEFGVVYFEDYIYNLTQNEGNYRNVRFSPLNQENALTKGVDSLVFYAAHSLQGSGEVLAVGDDNTLSNIRTGETGLSPAVLAANGQVLALGDITLITPLYHLVGGNDRFMLNLANWLSESTRDWDIRDFPYLFQGPVDVVQTFQPYLDPGLIASSAPLRKTFTAAGLDVQLRKEALPDNDVLYLGTFSKHAPAADLVSSAGITLTLPLTGTGAAESPKLDMPKGSGEGETGAQAETARPADGEEDDKTNLVEIAGLGTFRLQGTALYIFDQRPDRTTLVILAEDPQALEEALVILMKGDLEHCLRHENITLCALEPSVQYGVETGKGKTSSALGEPGKIDPELIVPPGTVSGGRILIFSDDDGPRGKRTGAAEFFTILGEYYEVTLWTASQDGFPNLDDLEVYDVIIIDSGDFAFNEDHEEDWWSLIDASANILFIGDQPFPPYYFFEEPAMVDDLVVVVEHTISEGLASGEVIQLSPSLSQVPALVFDTTDFASDVVVLNRGPESLSAGTPALIASQEIDEFRMIVAAFSFYRLPPEIQVKMAFNMVEWLLGDS